jgi:hypothetical protein
MSVDGHCTDCALLVPQNIFSVSLKSNLQWGWQPERISPPLKMRVRRWAGKQTQPDKTTIKRAARFEVPMEVKIQTKVF